MKLERFSCPGAPKPLGNYSHATGWRDLIFVSGIASRDFKTDSVPGLKMDSDGKKLAYDIRLETKATLDNIGTILKDCQSDFDHVLEVSVFLLDMKDFGAYNEVFASYFPKNHPARTTVAVSGLPGNIAIEMKVVAVRR